MPSMRSSYEHLLAGVSPDEVRAAVSKHTNQLLQTGLVVTVRDDRIKAHVIDEVNPVDGTNWSKTPWLTGTLSSDDQGTRITGTLNWFSQVSAPWTFVILAAFFAGGTALFWFGVHSHVISIAFGVLTVLVIPMAVVAFLPSARAREAGKREGYVKELNDALHGLVGLPPSTP